jgi:DNA-binding PadR family transcriptional regulator
MTSAGPLSSEYLSSGCVAGELPRPDRRLLTAWLLFLLDGAVMHGYQMCRELQSLGMRIDPPAVYRTLRTFESDGRAGSRWVEPAGGPRRRCYHLTAKGRRHLDEAVETIAASRELYDSFLRIRARSHAETTTTP